MLTRQNKPLYRRDHLSIQEASTELKFLPESLAVCPFPIAITKNGRPEMALTYWKFYTVIIYNTTVLKNVKLFANLYQESGRIRNNIQKQQQATGPWNAYVLLHNTAGTSNSGAQEKAAQPVRCQHLTIEEASNQLEALSASFVKYPSPIAITKNGKPEMALMSWKFYEDIVDNIIAMKDMKLLNALQANLKLVKRDIQDYYQTTGSFTMIHTKN